MKAFTLMDLALQNPKQYEGKKYKVIDGKIYNTAGELVDNFKISNGGVLIDENGWRAYISSCTEVEEIQQPVSFMKAMNSGKRIKPTVLRDKSLHTEYLTVYQWLNYQVLSLEQINGGWLIES